MDKIPAVLNLFSLVILIKLTKTISNKDTKSYAIFHTHTIPIASLLHHPLCWKCESCSSGPELSGDQRRDTTRLRNILNVPWFAAMLGWAGLGHTNCAFITNYAPLIVTNYIWHLPPPATSSLLSPHTHSRLGKEREDISVLVDGVQTSVFHDQARLMLFQLKLFTFYVKQQLAILWAQVTGLKTTVSKQYCAGNLCSGRRAALLRPPPHPGVNFLPNNPRWYETILKLPARNINSNCPVRALCSCP